MDGAGALDRHTFDEVLRQVAARLHAGRAGDHGATSRAGAWAWPVHACAPATAAWHKIAASVGYDSEAAFNRAFKRAYGCAPGLWRRRAGGLTPRAAPLLA